MNEDNPRPAPEPSAAEPLEYWHSTEPGPSHPLILVLCVVAGIAVGVSLVAFLGGVVVAGAAGIFEGAQNPFRFLAVLGTVIALIIAFRCGVHIVRRVREGKSLALEQRHRAGRFFAIGFLIGCGLACLAEGICFTAAVVAS